MPKPEVEFSLMEDVEWTPAPGYESDVDQKLLGHDSQTGNCTRLLRFRPGARSQQGLVHDFWEEVYILSGGLVDLTKHRAFTEGSYACRPPGMAHGPYYAPVGCVTLEMRYYVGKGTCDDLPGWAVGLHDQCNPVQPGHSG